MLTRGLVDGEYLGSRSALVTDSEGTRGVENLKAIGKVNEFQEIAINGLGENGLHDGLLKMASESEAAHKSRKPGHTCQPVTIAKSIGASTSGLHDVLNFSPWLPTKLQKRSTSWPTNSSCRSTPLGSVWF